MHTVKQQVDENQRINFPQVGNFPPNGEFIGENDGEV